MEKPHGIGLGGTRKEMWTIAHTGGCFLEVCLQVGSSREGAMALAKGELI